MKKIALLLGIALVGMSYNAVAATSAEPVSVEVVSAKPAENIDKLLKDYEKAINDYAKAVKQSNAGDSKVTAQLGKLKKQIDALGRKLQKLEAEMNPAQLKRYNAAQEKLASLQSNVISSAAVK